MKILKHLFKKKYEVDFTLLNQLTEKRKHFVSEKYALEEFIKRKVRFKKESIEESKYLYSLNKNKNKITKLNSIISGLNVKIEKEKANQLREYLFKNYNDDIGI